MCQQKKVKEDTPALKRQYIDTKIWGLHKEVQRKSDCSMQKQYKEQNIYRTKITRKNGKKKKNSKDISSNKKAKYHKRKFGSG